MAEKYLLDNGIPVYDVRMGTQEVLKLELVFLAGRPFERQKLAARYGGFAQRRNDRT